MNRGYATELAVSPFTAEQRQRLEAVTAARALIRDRTTEELLDVAEYIESGVRTRP